MGRESTTCCGGCAEGFAAFRQTPREHVRPSMSDSAAAAAPEARLRGADTQAEAAADTHAGAAVPPMEATAEPLSAPAATDSLLVEAPKSGGTPRPNGQSGGQGDTTTVEAGVDDRSRAPEVEAAVSGGHGQDVSCAALPPAEATDAKVEGQSVAEDDLGDLVPTISLPSEELQRMRADAAEAHEHPSIPITSSQPLETPPGRTMRSPKQRSEDAEHAVAQEMITIRPLTVMDPTHCSHEAGPPSPYLPRVQSHCRPSILDEEQDVVVEAPPSSRSLSAQEIPRSLERMPHKMRKSENPRLLSSEPTSPMLRAARTMSRTSSHVASPVRKPLFEDKFVEERISPVGPVDTPDDLLLVTPQTTPPVGAFFLQSCCATRPPPRDTEMSVGPQDGESNENIGWASMGGRFDASWKVVSKTWIRQDLARDSNRIFPLAVGDEIRATAIVRAELRTIQPAMGWVSLVAPNGEALVVVAQRKNQPPQSYSAIDFGEAFMSAVAKENASGAVVIARDLVDSKAANPRHCVAARRVLARAAAVGPEKPILGSFTSLAGAWGETCEMLDRAVWGTPEGPSAAMQKAVIRGDHTAAQELLKRPREGLPTPGNDSLASLPLRHVGMVEELLVCAYMAGADVSHPDHELARQRERVWEAVWQAATRCRDQASQRLRLLALRAPRRAGLVVTLAGNSIASGAYEYIGECESRPMYGRMVHKDVVGQDGNVQHDGTTTFVVRWQSTGEWWLVEDGADRPLCRAESGWLPPNSGWELSGVVGSSFSGMLPVTVRLEERLLMADTPHGSLLAVGSNQQGQLGVEAAAGGRTELWWPGRPVRVMLPADFHVTDVACGESHCVAVNVEGQLVAWGSNEYGQLGIVGSTGGVVVAADWKRNRQPAQHLPAYVASLVLAPETVPNGRVRFVAVAAGAQFTLALDSSGFLWAWGEGEGGVLGLGAGGLEGRPAPTRLESFSSTACRSVSCGSYHSMALSGGEELYAWGRAEGGQLGLSEQQIDLHIQEKSLNDSCVCEPQRVLFPPDLAPDPAGSGVSHLRIKQVDCGDVHACALDTYGCMWSWGWGEFGQLGLGFSGENYELGFQGQASKRPTPVMIPDTHFGSAQIHSIACGGAFSAAIGDGDGMSRNGILYMWGSNEHGQCAHPAKQPLVLEVPMQISDLAGIPMASIACGAGHAIALDTNGFVYSWGQGGKGQLGFSGPSPPLPIAGSARGTGSARSGGSGSTATTARIAGEASCGNIGAVPQHEPTQLRSLKHISIRKAVCGLYHSLLFPGSRAVPPPEQPKQPLQYDDNIDVVCDTSSEDVERPEAAEQPVPLPVTPKPSFASQPRPQLTETAAVNESVAEVVSAASEVTPQLPEAGLPPASDVTAGQERNVPADPSQIANIEI